MAREDAGNGARRLQCRPLYCSRGDRANALRRAIALLTMIVLLARQLGAVRANGRNQLSRRDFIAYFPMYAGLALIDLDQKDSFAVFCRLEAQRTQFAPGCVVVFGEQGH
jgi:hypothetical protein